MKTYFRFFGLAVQVVGVWLIVGNALIGIVVIMNWVGDFRWGYYPWWSLLVLIAGGGGGYAGFKIGRSLRRASN